MNGKSLMEKKGKPGEDDSSSDLELCGPCRDYDGIQEPCIAFCFQCVDFLCSNCTKEHCKNKKTRDHTLVHGSDKPKNKDVIQALKSLMYCQEHPTAELSHTCREHFAYICIHCITRNHKLCKDIHDIDDKIADIDANEKLFSDLQSDIRLTRNIIRNKKKNIEILAIDGRNIEDKQKTFIDSIITNLRHLEELSKENTQHMITEQTTHLQEEVKRYESIEQEQEVNQALANLVLKHGSTRLKTVGVDFIRKQSETLTCKIDQNVLDQEIRLKLDKNTLTFDDIVVWKILVEYRKREESADQLECSSDELVERANEILKLNPPNRCSADMAEAESSIPELHDVVPKTTISSTKQFLTETESSIPKLGAVPKKTNKSFMNRKISKADEKISVRTPYDSQTCSITGIIALSNNHIVLIDRANSKIKIFKHDFSSVKEHCLKDGRKPIDMCLMDGGTFAVVYKDANTVDIFKVQGGSIKFKKSFSTKYNIISITCTLDGDLTTLCSKENTEIQIYTTDGCMKQRITKFKSQYNADIQLKQPTCIHFTSRNEVLISNKHMVRAFYIGSKSSDTAIESWYYKNHEQQGLKQAGCTATDSEGNIYVCGKKSKNVHQISNGTYWKNRVIMTPHSEPLSIDVDNERDRILIGCENDDCLLVCQFL